MSSPPTRIGIAVVEQDGSYLVGVRGKDGPLPGHAEFPGGKCRAGESPRDCAVRECREETGLEVVPVEFLHNRTFDYPHGMVDLHFWLCRPARPCVISKAHQRFRWLTVPELYVFEFPEANEPVIELLAARSMSE